MATLIVDAGTASPLSLTVQTAGENAPIEVGTVTPSFNMTDRSSVRGTKMTFGALTTYLSTVNKDALINKLKSGRQISCSGDLLGNIQKLCTLRYTGARMLPQFADLWEVGLTGNEVFASNILLRYSPGDTIAGETFTASTTRSYYNAAGVKVSAAINVKRDGHRINGVGSAYTLLEDTRTNRCLQSENFGTTWGTSGTPTRSAAANTGSGISLDLLGDDSAGAVEFYFQAITFVGDGVKALSIFVKKGTIIAASGSVIKLFDNTAAATRMAATVTFVGGAPSVAMTTGTYLGFEGPLFGAGDGVYRLMFATTSVTAANNNEFDVQPAGTLAEQGNIYAGGVQAEDGAFCSSYIPTTAVAVTRGADSYSLPFTTPPQEMTVYAKFVEGGTASLADASLFYITNAAAAAPEFLCYVPAGKYRGQHHNGVAAVSSTPATGPALGDTEELALRLFGDGSTDITQSINGGASTSGAQSGALALATAWAGMLVWLNSAGTVGGFTGFTSLQSFKIVSGARSLAEMRAA